MNLDDRARSAVAAARASTNLLPAPEPRLARTPSRGVVVGVATLAAALLVAGLVVIGGEERRTQVVAGGAGSHLAPTHLPEGLELAGVDQFPNPGYEFPTGSLFLYGRAGEDNPFRAADLAVVIVDGGGMTGEEPVMIRGIEGQIIDEAMPGGGHGINWIEGERSVALLSRSVTVDELVPIAEAMTVSLEDPGLTGDELPDDLELVSHVDYSGRAFVAPYLLLTDGYSLRYSPPADEGKDERSLAVTIASPGTTSLDLFRWWFGPDAHATRVRGQDGVLATAEQVTEAVEVAAFPAPGGEPGEAPAAAEPAAEPKRVVTRTVTTILAWVEADGPQVTLTGTNIDEDELVPVAESLTSLSIDEWNALLDSAPKVEAGIQVFGGTQGDLLASGGTKEVMWWIRAEDGSSESGAEGFCLEITLGTGAGASTCGVDFSVAGDAVQSAPAAFGRGLYGERIVVFGRVAASVARVLVEAEEAGAVEAELVDDPQGDLRFAVAVMPAGVIPVEVVALDNEGREIDRQPVVDIGPVPSGMAPPSPIQG